MTLQEHYNSIVGGKGNKAQFLKQARHLFPQHITNLLDFDTTVNVLKSKQIISEAKAGGVVGKGFDIYDWKKILSENLDAKYAPTEEYKYAVRSKYIIGFQGREDILYFKSEEEAKKYVAQKPSMREYLGTSLHESVKAEEKNVSKEVEDYRKNAYNNADMKNADNVNFNELMKGFYLELKDPKNHDKTVDELKAMVVKNLAKDALYYTKEGVFGVEGVGYTDEAPGLKQPKEPKGKHKSSGYGDLDVDVEKVKANVQDTLGNKEAKTSMPKKVKEMPVASQNASGVKKMPMPGKEKKIKLKEGINLQEYGEDSGGQDMTYGMYSRSSTRKDQGNKDFIDKGYEDFYDGVPFEACPYESGFNKYYKADLAKLWQMGWKEAEAKAEDQLPPTADKDIPSQGMTEESKVRSLIAKLIKEELK